ncbi:mandelate racemase/muconate lactonizing enzyme family protein [Sphingosinicella terrae]|uniref:mandelate racemase/muconate lactonizing enzyme family protein n=1 Tax=Sphingosinicella terrae TaxID=2172047 RepID=UPI000E0CE9A8|nr:mandelate racemase/muconate lactonizing enzyme family protein [Sphingosinicella terrae]
MRITGLDILHVDGGFSVFSYLKVTTDAGLTGWAEFSGHETIPGHLREMKRRIAGADPCDLAALDAVLFTYQRHHPAGSVGRAIGAVMNACLDIKSKAAGLPVHALLGGAVRRRIPLYWSHCGLFRVRFADLFETIIGKPPIRTLDDLKAAGREVADAGFRALKTNLIRFDSGTAATYSPGIGRSTLVGHPELNIDPAILRAFTDQIEALRDGAGPDVEIAFDLNCNFRPEGYRKLARAAEPFDLMWLEIDMLDARALASLRASTTTPIASLEKIMRRHTLRPYLEREAVDVAIIDAQWTGVWESVKMAHMLDAYEINVAAHNSAGPLGARMSAHFCAAIPNFRIMEHEVDAVPWAAGLLEPPNLIESGEFVIDDGPGWGAEVDEEAARAHPATDRPEEKLL